MFRALLESASLLCKNAVQTSIANSAGHQVKERDFFYSHEGGKRKGGVQFGLVASCN